MHEHKILIIGLVWPEPGSSAAGSRMVQLVKLFLEHHYEVTFATAASKSDYSFNLNNLGVQEKQIKLNDASFNNFLTDLNPDMVMFDRYMVEEQYGWRVSKYCPNAVKVLDTEDLHCLRHARQQSIKKEDEVDYFNETSKREIAAIFRCDLSLIISEVEMDLLKSKYQVNPTLLYFLPFLEEPLTQANIANWKPYQERDGFLFIGNFLHEPNWHTLQVLKTKVWPIISKELPKAKIHIYGAYAGQKVMQLHNEKERFLIHGRAQDARQTMAQHKILLAPIAFGAGIKGKFIDAMQTGTPTLSTNIGAEAMKGDLPWNGYLEDDHQNFAQKAVMLYQNEGQWKEAAAAGIRIINERFAKNIYAPKFIKDLDQLKMQLNSHRNKNFIGQMLQHHSMNSLKYMSLWIEEKNKST